MHKTRGDAERFWEKVDRRDADDCWPWLGTKSNNGYGTFSVGSRLSGDARNVSPHRYVCELVGRTFGPGQHALHHCDNKQCVNPSHIYVGTQADNARDFLERGTRKVPDQRGEKNPRAKLSASEATEIRRSSESLRSLSARFGVSKTHVSWIKHWKSWGHLNA